MPNNQFMSASAPQMMLAPDIATQQNQLARQQQLADMLRERSLMQDSPTEMVSGWAIKKSPWEGVSKLAQALGSGYMQKNADDKQMALAKAMQERMGAAFDNMAGGARPGAVPSGAAPAMSAPQNQPIDPMQVTEGAPAGAMPSPQPAPAPMAAPAQLSQVDQIRNQAKAAYMMGNTELANKLLENISTMTTEQRNMAAMGQNPLEMGRLGTAAARKAGIIELQPGTTALDLNTGVERFQPKVGEGITLNNGVASALPGYAGANAEIAGASAGAVSGAQAGNKMVTVNVGGRPVMMTEAQAVQMSGGGAPQAGVQFNNPNQGGLSLDFKGGPQATFDMISQIKDPAIRAQAMQALKQMPNTPAAAPGGIGIPGSTAAENELEVGQVRNTLAIEKSRIENAQSPEQQQKLVDAKGVLGLLDAAEPLLTSGVPTASAGGVLRDQVTGAFGMSTEASKAAAQLAAIGGALVSKMPKMSGPQSDKDVAQYKEMAGKLGDPYTPIGDRQAAAQILRQLTEKYLSENQGSIASQALRTNTGNAAPYTQAPAKQPPPSAQPAALKFDAPPPAAQFAGKRMRAPDGSIMRSDGKNWIKE